jgi:hypothetical protein
MCEAEGGIESRLIEQCISIISEINFSDHFWMTYRLSGTSGKDTFKFCGRGAAGRIGPCLAFHGFHTGPPDEGRILR